MTKHSPRPTLMASLLAVVVIMAAAMPALASITLQTLGQFKCGGLILGGTTITATGAELNKVADEVASVATTDTPATGTDAVQFTFKNAAGTAVGSTRGLTMYTSDSAGQPSTALTSYATLTNGKIVTTATGAVALAVTTSAGLLGVTITAPTGSYRLSFTTPSGRVITSPPLTVN